MDIANVEVCSKVASSFIARRIYTFRLYPCLFSLQTFQVRDASNLDIDTIIQLEVESWTRSMRHPRKQLLNRIESRTCKVFVLEMAGLVVGSILAQRISSLDAIGEASWSSEDELAQGDGPVLQLLRVNTLVKSSPSCCAGMAVGAILRDFCLVYARALGIDLVCAVTKTTHFGDKGTQLSYEDYVSEGLAERFHPDRGLNFHISKGAKVIEVMPRWRPEDEANVGYGVLIAYDLTDEALTPMVLNLQKNTHAHTVELNALAALCV